MKNLSVSSIQFVDETGQRFWFERDAEDEVFSLVLSPIKKGIHTLFVNGEDETYRLRPEDIIEQAA